MKKLMCVLLAAVLMAMGLGSALGEGVAYQRVSISDGSMTVGRTVVPQGYSVQSNLLYFDGSTLSMTSPVQLIVEAFSADGSVDMVYTSIVDYIHILEKSTGGVPYGAHQDGVLDQTTMCMMMTEMTAGQYADAMINKVLPSATFLYETPVSAEMQAALEMVRQENYNQFSSLMNGSANGMSISIDDVRVGVAERFYSVELSGIPYRVVAMTAVSAVETTMSAYMLYGGETIDKSTTWSAPYCYVCLAPEENFDATYADFCVFVANTSESDQFVQARTTLSNQIRESILSGRSQSYAQMFAGDLGSGDSYNEDRFTDYIMGQNDYQLSSGEHVKIPTEYDYVYEDGNGGIYATDSALDEPAGMTQLQPSH